MRKHSYLFLFLLLLITCNGNDKKPTKLDATIERRIDSVMAHMTLEEKVGQMSQFALDIIGKGGNAYFSNEPFEIDPLMLDSVIGKYKVGSILNTSNNRARITEVWETIVRTIQERALRETGIPVVYASTPFTAPLTPQAPRFFRKK